MWCQAAEPAFKCWNSIVQGIALDYSATIWMESATIRIG
jgi:hypothetical protein